MNPLRGFIVLAVMIPTPAFRRLVACLLALIALPVRAAGPFLSGKRSRSAIIPSNTPVGDEEFARVFLTRFTEVRVIQ
jgi:hypothetical protein